MKVGLLGCFGGKPWTRARFHGGILMNHTCNIDVCNEVLRSNSSFENDNSNNDMIAILIIVERSFGS